MLQNLRIKLNETRKNKQSMQMQLIQVVIGEADTVASRKGKITDEEVEKIVRKVIAGNNETIETVKKTLLKSVLGDTLPENPEQEVRNLALQQTDVAFVLNNYDDLKTNLTKENEFLNTLVPQTLSVEEIKSHLVEILESLKGANSDGQATGQAIKHLKTKNLKVSGDEVSVAVKALRS